MREDDDSTRSYGPLIRRIVILVTVIVAVPVVLWSITDFMRTYVAQPKVPTFRSLASQPLNAPPDTAASVSDTAAAAPATTASLGAPPPPKPIVSASAATSDVVDPTPAPQGPTLADRFTSIPIKTSAIGPNGAVIPAPLGAAPPGPSASNSPPPVAAGSPWPDATPSSIPAASAGPQQAAGDQDSSALPPADPLVGPVPLPHPRPRYLALADRGIPMPRPRPAASSDAEPPSSTNGGGIGWLGKIFHPADTSTDKPAGNDE